MTNKSTLTGGADSSLSRKCREDLFPGRIKPVSKRHMLSHPEEDNVFYIGVLSDLYRECRNVKQRIKILEEIKKVVSNLDYDAQQDATGR